MQTWPLAVLWLAVAAYCFYTALGSGTRSARAGRVLIGLALALPDVWRRQRGD